MMSKTDVKTQIRESKAAKGLTWDAIAEKIRMSPEWTASACLGMNSMPAEQADALCSTLDLPAEVSTVLRACPNKQWDQIVPTDPLIYRFYEIMGVYGETFKEIIHEKFGDGIMSAIDFSMKIDKQADPKGDRVVVTFNGKFLPYRSW